MRQRLPRQHFHPPEQASVQNHTAPPCRSSHDLVLAAMSLALGPNDPGPLVRVGTRAQLYTREEETEKESVESGER